MSVTFEQVGTVEVRSLVEPLRKLVARVRGHFIQGAAVDIDFENQLLEIKNSSENFYLPCVASDRAVWL
jgi:NADH dehydrogenase